MRNYILGFVSVLVLIGIAGGAYYIGKQKSTPSVQEVSTTTSPTNTNTPASLISPSPTPEATPDNNVSEQVIAAIKTKNTQPIEGYMADTIQVRLESSSCCGPLTKTEAMSQLSYLDPATGWDFDPTNPIIVNVAAASPQFYGTGWIVGVASNEYLFSFKLNSQNKIEAYNLAATYKLITP